ncbi:MAG TPA: cell division protein FtsZ, partial [Thermoanaerobaculia bacterium]|nr:cell division protein FtsZ [Thermoanaerobaculia bacterium]
MILFDEEKGTTRPTAVAVPEAVNVPAKIRVVGVGGGGGNAVNRMIDAQLGGIEFIAANTDLQALVKCRAPLKLQIGDLLTKGLGAGADPEMGRKAALEDTEKILELLDGADMVFLTAGLGGGTGSGAAPIIASLASEIGALTVAVVTKPFAFEGRRRMQIAEQSIEELRGAVDTLITIPNERLLSFVERGTPLSEAFR